MMRWNVGVAVEGPRGAWPCYWACCPESHTTIENPTVTDSLAVIAPAETAIGPPRRAGRGHVKTPLHPLTVETALTYPMRRRIPPANVAVARTAQTLHRMRLGSRSESSIRAHAAARRTALT